jgi:plastocyanin
MRFAALTLALAALVLPATGAADNPVLTGDVGKDDSFAISLVDASGAPVTHVDAGTYTIVVHDHSSEHNFHLFGTGVNATTDVAAIGDSTFTVTFMDGVYRYVCDPHSFVMKGQFTVGTPPAEKTPAPAPSAAARLGAAVGPGAKISLRGAAGLGAGKAVLTIKDASEKDNFRLVGPGVNRATGVAFRGTVKWTVALRAGTYVYRSDRNKKLRGKFTVS